MVNMEYKYFVIMCECSIEVRPYHNQAVGIIIRGLCPRCHEATRIEYFENILTPGFEDYEGEYLYKGGEQ